jgi:hypothetical protein
VFRVLILLLLVTFSSLVLAQSATVTIDGEVFRDPMQPPWAILPSMNTVEVVPERETLLNSLQLSFVRSGGLTPIAVINGTQVTIGDLIEGASVEDIRPGEVVLVINGEERVLSRIAQSVRTPVEQ